jgi:hypothetical protein
MSDILQNVSKEVSLRSPVRPHLLIVPDEA